MNPRVESAWSLWKRMNNYFNGQKWYLKQFEHWFADLLPTGQRVDPDLLQNFFVKFALFQPIAEGETLLQRFLNTLPKHADAERAIVLGWLGTWHGVAQVQERIDGGLAAFDLVTCRPVSVATQTSSGDFPDAGMNGFLVTYLAPVEDAWSIPLGSPQLLPPNAQSLELAQRIARSSRIDQADAVMRSNAGQAESSQRIRRLFAQKFARHFGGREWMTRGHEYAKGLRAFYAELQEEGKAGNPQDPDYVPWHELALPEQFTLELPPALAHAEDLGMICEETESPSIQLDYGKFRRVMDADDPESIPGWKKLVRQYFADPSVTELVFRFALERNAERTLQRIATAMEFTQMTGPEFDQALRIAKGNSTAVFRAPNFVPPPDWSGVRPVTGT